MFLFTNLFTADLLYRQIKNIVIILILLSPSIFAQTETEHWEQKKTDCKIIQHTEKDYSVDTSSLGITLLSGFVNTYYFLISDLDGDNKITNSVSGEIASSTYGRADIFISKFSTKPVNTHE